MSVAALPPPFTPDQARVAGQRSGAVRRQKKIERDAELASLRKALLAYQQPPVQTPPEPPTVQKVDSQARSLAVSRIETQLEGIDKLIDATLAEEKDTKDRPNRLDRLSSARNRLFEHWCCLTGQPKPGNRKPAPDRPVRQSASQIVLPQMDEPVNVKAMPVEPTDPGI